MRILIVVVADIFIAGISLFTTSEIFGLKRYNSFTVPYTDKMISLGIIEPDKRDAVLREDRMNHLAGIAISVLACILMARFLAWPSGLIVFVLALAASFLLTHPDMSETEATREGYFRMHKASMDPRRYAEMVQSQREAGEKRDA